jgi:carbamoyltransferase
MPEAILGISAYFHDSAAALLVDGKIIAAAQEERFTRIKHDASFPRHAVAYVLEEAGLEYDELTAVAYYEKPLLKFERLLETYHAFAPRGLQSFLKAMPVWMKEKIFFRRMLGRELSRFGKKKIPLYFPEHHLSHAGSAFYPSPFEVAAILTVDGVGEWANTTIGYGKGSDIGIIQEQHFPHSLGLLYSAFTYYLGFEVNGGEYKLMGLAAYGDVDAEETKSFIAIIQDQLVDIRPDGSIVLNMRYFRFATHLRMTEDSKWKRLFGFNRRGFSEPVNQSHANLAFAIQQVSEKIVTSLAKTALQQANCKNLVMAGGVALNSVANGKLLDLPELETLWIQPAAGDAGGALGAAYAVHHIVNQRPREIQFPDAMQGAYLGPSFSDQEVFKCFKKFDLEAKSFSDEELLLEETVISLLKGNVVGWFQGRMEFGPRALGSRSILGDPRNPEMQQKINQSIKFRESFRPFAPSVLAEDAAAFFNINCESPYMLLVREVLPERRLAADHERSVDLMERLRQQRSDIPAITHVDYTARIQTVDQHSNPRYRKLLEKFKEKTGYGMLINTSFNVKDEPIVCTPEDAIRCFLKTDMDSLVIENYLLRKKLSTEKKPSSPHA